MLFRRWQSLALGTALAACEFPGYVVHEELQAEGDAGAPATPDHCLAMPCQNDGRCITVSDSFVCLCADGFRGASCEISFNNCSPDPCQNGGSCVEGVDMSHCDCPDGWDGTTCEHNVDDCNPNPCRNGATCIDGFKSFTCQCAPGYIGDDCSGSLPADCHEILDTDPTQVDGIYWVDPDGPGRGNPPLEVKCDMHSAGGGWTLVGQEREGEAGTFKFLGVSVGDSSAAVHKGDSALFGEQFAGLYEELFLSWSSQDGSSGAMHMRVGEEVFSNSVRTAMPVTDFWTSDDTLNGWIQSAGGGVLCRASRNPDVRPGDTSWGIKPQNAGNPTCGCSSSGWQGQGAFYGGHPDATACLGHSGGWAGVSDNGQDKGSITKYALTLWVR